MTKTKYVRIDEDGFYVEDVLFDAGIIPVDEDIVLEVVPEGLYRPRWDGTAWVEGLTQQEIDELQNQPQEPTDAEKIAQLEADKAALQSEVDFLKARDAQIQDDLMFLYSLTAPPE